MVSERGVLSYSKLVLYLEMAEITLFSVSAS